MGSVATRLVLLGASNLTMGLPVALGAVRARLGPGPFEILVAAGHGRSYGRWSRVMLRGLPGIVECGLWTATSRRDGDRTYALLTDIGNDLAYGAVPAELLAWVAACLDRLTLARAEVVVTLLPAASLARLAPWQYQLLKAMLFPGRRLPFRVIQARVAEVNAGLAALAAERGIRLVEPEAAWYGADAIHLHPRRQAAAWGAMAAGWVAPDGAPPGVPPAAPAPPRRLAPEWRTVCGVSLRRRQPSATLADGTTLSLF
jgi:hypothetical protein